ncbi:adenylate/guanylate cyclase domain-containing protein [Aliikangiella sp. G2MR2-5]|uniref:adenylate/guanylate cyclase domain-containing protein n=1 Tax=Aliikangiella sp. G2MR2-5 TaxID=2788943 RepID=UPI0018AA42CA|nr:adenylate/guanylate cyclase domain-containing protein [Aliikangiella sp. G2MR2-5]
MGKHTDTIEKAILFADIEGSSALYQSLGNREANNIISELLEACRRFICQYCGKVIKNIGDEIMCVFPDASSAVLAAIKIQKQFSSHLLRSRLKLNIGVGFGEVVSHSSDVFGEAVNQAALLTQVAAGGKILISKPCYLALNANASIYAQPYDSICYKGSLSVSEVFRIYWQDEQSRNQETLLTSVHIDELLESAHLTVTCCDQVYELSKDKTPFYFGRDSENCDFLLEDSAISRNHCHIEMSRGKFTLVDHSTNGCYLANGEQPDVYIRRESFPILSQTKLSLGRKLEENRENIIILSVSYPKR